MASNVSVFYFFFSHSLLSPSISHPATTPPPPRLLLYFHACIKAAATTVSVVSVEKEHPNHYDNKKCAIMNVLISLVVASIVVAAINAYWQVRNNTKIIANVTLRPLETLQIFHLSIRESLTVGGIKLVQTFKNVYLKIFSVDILTWFNTCLILGK